METNMESSTILWETTEGVGVITLNRPEKYNAMSREMLLDLGRILEEAGADEAVKTLVVTGTGKAFCTGGDLIGHPSFETEDPGPVLRKQYVWEGNRLPLVLQKMEKPVIAAVNGIAAGAGMDLALACDIRMVSDQAKFTEVFVRAGLMNDMGGSWSLARIVGLGKALELILTGDTIDAHEAYRIGLANHVVPQEELMTKTMELAGRFAKGPTQAYKLIKWSIYRALNIDLEAASQHELFGQSFLLGTADVKNAVKSFIDKKLPVFKGC
jgi:2-(1,2-epoxy-1,2-dihydrophenyl)acetyl-CoA isomerase